MKILFIQLPLGDHSYSYINGNIEYAPSSISGYIHQSIDHKIEISTLPYVLTCFGSDSIIIKYIININPDVIAFTSYLWNIERNHFIAMQVKKISGDIKIIFGGPEINPGSISMQKKREEVDFFVSGEGEWFFKKYFSKDSFCFSGSYYNGNYFVTQPQEELILSSEIFEPLTNNRLNKMLDGSTCIELTRGCPYKCTYCYYSKNCNKVREQSFSLLIDAIISHRGIDEICILSPTFNKTSNFKEKLKILSKINRNIKLHTEMRTEGIDKETASLLYNAGFRSMEVGLQTLNENSLKAIGRNSNPEKEITGMLALKEAGIDLKIGIIPGLPEDRPDEFIGMINRLVDLGFRENIELYPLMILPGTTIFDHAVRDKINFLFKPPYYYLDGWNFTFDDLKSIVDYTEKITGYSQSINQLPGFTTSTDGLFIKGVTFNGDDIAKWNNECYLDLIETNLFHFIIHLSKGDLLSAGLSGLLNNLPENVLFNIIVFSNSILDEDVIIDYMLKTEGDNFFRRLNSFNDWRDGLKIRFYQVFDDIEIFFSAESNYSLIEPIFHLTLNTRSKIDYFSDGEKNLLISNGIFYDIKDFLYKHYSNGFELIAFENKKDQNEFYRMINFDFIEMPFSFKTCTSS